MVIQEAMVEVILDKILITCLIRSLKKDKRKKDNISTSIAVLSVL